MANEISFEEFNAKYAPKQQDTEISFDDFNAKYAAEPKSRSFGDVASDAGSQLGKGVNTIAGAIPNLLDPSSPVSKFFNDNAQYWQNDQSQITKSLEAAADARIAEAAKTGQWEAFKTAVKEYGAEPALVQKLILENIPSMIPGLAAAKGAQIAAKGSVIAGTVAGAGTNSLLNAGGARQESYQDIKSTLIAQGVPEAEADAQALEKSKVAAGVGAVTGALSGGSGLERGILGGAKGGFAKRAGVELGGEQLEEVAPTIATNVQLDRDMLTGVGETSAKTLIASSPGSVISGFQGNSQPVQPAPTGATQPDIASSSNVDELISATKSSIDVELDNQTNQDLLDEISASNNATSSNAPVDQSYVPQPDTEPRPTINIAPDVAQTPIIEQSQPTDLNVNPVQASQEQQPTEGATNGTTSQYADPMLDSGSAASTSSNLSGSTGNSVLRYDATIGTGGLGLPGTVVETDGASGVSANGSNKQSSVDQQTVDRSLPTVNSDFTPTTSSTLLSRSTTTPASTAQAVPTTDSALSEALKPLRTEILKFKGEGKTVTGTKTIYDATDRLKTIAEDTGETSLKAQQVWFNSKRKTLEKNGDIEAAALFERIVAQLKERINTAQEPAPVKIDDQVATVASDVAEKTAEVVSKDLDRVSLKFWKGETFRDIAPKVISSRDVYTKKEPRFTGSTLGVDPVNFDYFLTDGRRSQKINKAVYDHIESLKSAKPQPVVSSAETKPLELHYTVEFDAAKLGLNPQDYKSQNELSIAIAEAEHNLTAQGKEALEALLLEDQFDEIFGEKLTDTEIESWLSLLDNNEENDNSTTQGATESGVTEGTPSGEQDRDAEAQGKEGVEVAGNNSVPTPISQDRVAESANDMFAYLKKSEGGIVHKGKILYPAIKVIGMPGVFQWRNGSVKKITDGGIGIKDASEDESNDVIDALEKDQAQIVLNSHWGGSGKDTGQQSVSVIHNPKGMEYKAKDDWINNRNGKPATSTQEAKPQSESKPLSEMTPSDLLRAAADKMDAESKPDVSKKAENVDTSKERVKGIDTSKLTHAKPSTIDTPAQGVLNQAKEGKAKAWEKVKSLRERISNEPLNGNRSGLRIELLKAEDRHREYQRNEKEALAAIEKRANELGFTTIKSNSPKFSKSSSTINVNGIERSRLNSNGKPIANTDEALHNFWEWFSDSKVVDDQGRPLVVYHGTNNSFDEFSKESVKSRFPYSFGLHFTTRTQEASVYADSLTNAAEEFNPKSKFAIPAVEGGNVMPSYLKSENPLEIVTDMSSASMEADTNRYDIIGKLMEAKKNESPYDSVIIKRQQGDEYDGQNIIVFDPNQVKSAIGNNGDFNKSNNSILKSQSTPAQNTHTVASATSSMLEAHTGKIKSVLQAMLDTGKAKVVTAKQAAGIVGEDAMSSDAQAFYSPADKVTYFVADQIPIAYTAQEFKGLVLHEIAVHAKELGKDSKEFKSILAQVDMMRKAGNKAITAAFERVPKDTSPEHVTNEALAYAIQHSPQLGIVQRFLSWFRNAIRAIGKSFPTLQKMRLNVWANNLNESDLRFMAESALKNAEPSGVQNESDTPQFSKLSHTATAAFKKWFGESKVVDGVGRPLIVYHGAPDARFVQEDGTFKTTSEKYGGNEPDRRAFWFTDNRATASSYAKDIRAFDYQNAEPGIIEAYIKLENPLIINAEGKEWRSAQQQGKTSDVIAQARAGGHDGVIIRNVKDDYNNHAKTKSSTTFTVFSPNQIKSTDNNGDFSQSNNNILFSKNTNPATHQFQPENSGKPLDSWIKIFTRNQIVTLYRDSLIGKKLEEYKELRELVTADTNKLFEKADNFLLELRQIPKGLRDAFASLAHDSTLNNVDPSNPKYVPSPDAIKLADYLANNPTNQTLAAKIKKRLNSMEAAHKKLHAEFNALPAKEQELFKELRSKYTEQMTMVFDEFKNRIGRTKNVDSAIKISSIKKLDEQLTDLLGRVYFPLYRAGNYIVKAEKAGEPTTVDHVESNFAADRLEKKLKKLGYTVSRSTRIVSPQNNKSNKALNAVRDLLDKAALGGKIEGAALSQLIDDIDQTVIQSLPDQSYRKSFIHRKGTKGYSDDFIRAYADAMRRGSINIANLRHGDKITTVIEDMRKDVKAASKVPGSNVAALNQVLDRVEQIEVDIRNPTSKLVSVSGKIAFAQMLGSLSNFILNITQTPLLTMPHLGAEYGYGKANLQLAMAYAKQMRSLKKQGTLSELGRWLDMRHGLVGNELDLMQQLHDSGALDLTQSFDLIDSANNPSYQENELSMNFMKVIALPQHVSEIVNRQVTALATIRLEMARSGSPLKAYRAAIKSIDETHFNYCVDLETECLTTDGWKKQPDIKVGDIAMSVDDEGRAVESSITEINIFKGGHTAHHFSHSNRRFSMVVTPDHDCLAQSYCSRERKWYGIKKIKARDLCGSHHLLRTPLKAIDGRDDYLGEDFAALLGWIAAEGHYAKFRNCKENKDVRLHQSDSHNPEYVKEIRGILTRLGGEFKEYTRKQDKVLMWVISGDLRKKIIDIMPHKVLTFEMAKKMPAKEMMAVLLSFAKGDGYFMDECKSSCVIGQKTGKNSFNLEVLQSMAIQCGLSSARHAGDSVRQTLMVNFAKSEIGRSNKRSMVKTLKKEIITVDTVWCPTTENGKWIARRNGAVFVTGNSKENRSKLMTGNTQSILFRFKQYAQQAAFLFVHTAKLALDGSTNLDSDGNKLDGTRPSERTKARKQLAGVLGMQILVAGTLGLPVFAEAAVAASGVAGFKLAGSTGAYVGVAGAMIIAAALAFGDDDGEEFDVEVKKWFIQHFGKDIGSSLADGIIPRGLASRLNASELVIRRPKEARNSTDFANQWMISLLGAFWGGTVYNAGVGLKDIVEGDTAKGATKLIPVKAIKDLVTSWKWANDGMNVTNKDGEIITPVSKADIFFKSIGINPTSVVNAREYDNAKFTLHNALLKKQQKALKELREETDKTKRFNAIIKYNKFAPLGYEIDSDKVRGVIAREIKYKGKPNVVTGNPVQEDYLNKNTKELRPAY